ncbi:hypothetical protein KIH87_14485 [Paraneptunicella aestuarii]|uniref:hypothetical protein n=1 Tax=Paraneptunicella aestuarii TaxID=2831148 RepID=UPI001E3DC379|nr:hypothetical protein [Paraneptunicella aestuarii]UAA37891.1 hypothetical protein KIH87_14485 [Paraneptunicella aestuarii]
MAGNQALTKAHQAVAQSTAIAIQDASDNLRNLSTITTTTIGIALAKLLATGDTKYATVIEEAQKVLTKGAESFADIGEKAAKIAKDYPSE